jgi:hypothetical protein
MKIIDDTYDGSKFPIVEREYNAYYFPENYNPDNTIQQVDDLTECYENHCKIKIYNRANPR